MDNTKNAVAILRSSLYTVFVDFNTAFDLTLRNRIILTLAKIRVAMNVLSLFVSAVYPIDLAQNTICVHS